MLQQLAVGDGNTQGGGSYMLNESEITPPNPRRTGSDAATLLAPVLADYDERMGKIESAVAGITASQQLAQQQQQVVAETTGAQMAQILALLTQKNQAANSPTTENSAATKIAPAPAPQLSEPAPASAAESQQSAPPPVKRGGGEAGLSSLAQPAIAPSMCAAGMAPSDQLDTRHPGLASARGPNAGMLSKLGAPDCIVWPACWIRPATRLL